jgi:hypothetical protein
MIKTLKVGTIVLVSHGAYSDYTVDCVARVLKPINKTVWAKMKAACGAKSEADEFYGDLNFALPWFLDNGYLVELESRGMHLGSYNELRNWEAE